MLNIYIYCIYIHICVNFFNDIPLLIYYDNKIMMFTILVNLGTINDSLTTITFKPHSGLFDLLIYLVLFGLKQYFWDYFRKYL